MSDIITEFQKGQYAAMMDVATGHVYDVEAAILSFVTDPPDSDFQLGYRQELEDMLDV